MNVSLREDGRPWSPIEFDDRKSPCLADDTVAKERGRHAVRTWSRLRLYLMMPILPFRVNFAKLLSSLVTHVAHYVLLVELSKAEVYLGGTIVGCIHGHYNEHSRLQLPGMQRLTFGTATPRRHGQRACAAVGALLTPCAVTTVTMWVLHALCLVKSEGSTWRWDTSLSSPCDSHLSRLYSGIWYTNAYFRSIGLCSNRLLAILKSL